ncbi:MAG: Wzz/FepE/Etk N-terminal domain-containing protein [Chloroflexota bacterium]|nr:Wzz/FepE/Etk N-terminal domain-containing protein [Chloroflexota bacterium]
MKIEDILEYIKIIRKWWLVIAVLFAVTVGTMLAITFLTEPQYEATVTLQVSAPPPQEVPLYSQFGRRAISDEIEWTRSSFSELLLEGDVAWRALETIPQMQTQMTGGELRDEITVDLPEASQLMHVGVRAPYTETAALLANTLVETALKQYGQILAEPTANTRGFIEGELRATQEELAVAEIELTQFRTDNGIADLSETLKNQGELIQDLRLRGDIARASGEMAQAQALDEIITEREAELHNMIVLSAKYTELIDHVERVRATQNFLLDKISEAQIKENQILQLGSIQIITPARPPRKPILVIDNKIIALGAIASLLGGVLLAFLLEYLEISGALRGFQGSTKQSNATASDHTG